jgi:ubiquinone/menaquinone biosynthesis C-methylase UbiE
MLADLHPGEVDLGSGGGIDMLLWARRVAPGGEAYGLDMTPETLDLARRTRPKPRCPTPSSRLRSGRANLSQRE